MGVYFNIFPNFLPISESGGVTKSQPIDPFFYVIYLFLNIRFGQKSVQISYFLPSTLLFLVFILFHLHFFDDFFLAQPPIISGPKNFFALLKIFFPPKIFLPPLKIFLPPKFFSSSPNFCCASLQLPFLNPS